MNAVISPATTRRTLDLALRRHAVPASRRRRGHALRQAGTFAAIGIVSTLAYVALYALLRPAAPAELANAAALLATAIGNTAANRRLTFAVRGRAGLARDHAAGLLALGAALAITSAALAVLQVAAPGAPQAIEVAVLVAANAAVTLVRFLLLREALHPGRPRVSPPVPAGPVTAGPMLERTVR
jgi:putative flippase GtrA